MGAEKNSPVNGEETISMSASEAKALWEKATLQDIKRRVIIWAGGWVTVLSIVLAIIGLIGADSIVKSVIDKELDDKLESSISIANEAATEAMKSAGAASNAAESAIDATAEATKEAKKLALVVDELKSQTKDLNTRLASIGQQIENASQRAAAKVKVDIDSLQKQVNKVVAALEKQRESSGEPFRLEAEQKQVIAQAEEAIKDFEDNSQYTVRILITPASDEKLQTKLRIKLNEIGFRTFIYPYSPPIYIDPPVNFPFSGFDTSLALEAHAIAFDRFGLPKAEIIRNVLLSFLPTQVRIEMYPMKLAGTLYVGNFFEIPLEPETILLIF